MGWSGVMLVGFLGRFDSIEHDPVLIDERFRGIMAVPFSRAYFSSEFEAGENILLKLTVFATLTFLLCGWCSRLTAVPASRTAISLSVAWCFVLGLGIEVAQVFLPPQVPDVTDLILYALGAMIGVVGFSMLIPNKHEALLGK